jgi:hypothetical protein
MEDGGRREAEGKGWKGPGTGRCAGAQGFFVSGFDKYAAPTARRCVKFKVEGSRFKDKKYLGCAVPMRNRDPYQGNGVLAFVYRRKPAFSKKSQKTGSESVFCLKHLISLVERGGGALKCDFSQYSE